MDFLTRVVYQQAAEYIWTARTLKAEGQTAKAAEYVRQARRVWRMRFVARGR